MRTLPMTLLMALLAVISCKSTEHTTSSGSEQGKHKAEQSTHKESSLKQSLKEIDGQWRWIKTDCCGRMTKTTYAQEGEEPKVIAFSTDGTAQYFADETRTKTTEKQFTLGTLGDQPTITIGEMTPALFGVEKDTLVISWGYIDLQTEYYVRVK